MGRTITTIISALLIISCTSVSQNKLVESSFSFKNYDFLVVSNSELLLLDIDTEFGDLMQIYSMKALTTQEYEQFSFDNKKRTLFAKISLDTKGETDLLNILFEDTVTGEAKRNFSGVAEGDMLESEDRSKALQLVSNKIIKALKEDKGLIDNNKLLADEREVILPGIQPNTTDTLIKSYRVTADTLNVRKAPIVGLDIIEKVNKGDVLKKISSLLGWAKVELPSGKTGWVSMKYLQPIDETQ